jgi:UTP--glucose-1-phosphate uridylyltransferase/phosphoglucomutase
MLHALQVPLVKLDDKYFKLVDQMERLTPRPPSLVAARSLTVKVDAGHAALVRSFRVG